MGVRVALLLGIGLTVVLLIGLLLLRKAKKDITEEYYVTSRENVYKVYSYGYGNVENELGELDNE